MISKVWFILALLITPVIAAQSANPNIIQPVRVFQIGFSKCGTSTIAAFFNGNGIPAIHHDFGNLTLSIHENAQQGLPLIGPEYAKYLVFTDMENMFDNPPINSARLYYKELDRQYPGSKFILNTRDKKAWLKSRAKHITNTSKNTVLEENAKNLNLSKKQVLALWGQDWDAHHKDVLEYFKDRPNDLLVFNIETDPPKKLIEFLQDYYILDAQHYLHKNKSHTHTPDDDELVANIELFSKNYALGPHPEIFKQEAKDPGPLKTVIPVIDSLLKRIVAYTKQHKAMPTAEQLNVKTLQLPHVYRLKNWASQVYPDQPITQTGYLQGYLNGKTIGLEPGIGGMFTCLLVHRQADIMAKCYYQIKEM